MKLGLPFSISIIFWAIIGLARYLKEKRFSKPKRIRKKKLQQEIDKVAVCIPAHNEEIGIKKTIKSIKKLVPSKHIYVISDGSTDNTTSIARSVCDNVMELVPGKGKAKALVSLIGKFKLYNQYEFILFVDADTVLNTQYLRRAMKVFITQPNTAAIACYVLTVWRKNHKLSKKNFIAAYRVRLNILLQILLVYGQTWKYFDAAMVIPGSASIYRTSVLRKLKIDTPGILIEDFNLAFQIHKKRLGKIAHFPEIYSFDKEPTSLKDYWNQVKRWNIGYYQTVRKHGIWPSLFWLSAGFFTLEVFINAVVIISLPWLLLIMTILFYATIINPYWGFASQVIWKYSIPIWEIFIIAFILDYIYTIYVSLKIRKFKLLIFGLGFMLIRYLDSLILLSALPKGLFSKSKGFWTPPKRK